MTESQSRRLALDLLDRYLASECTSAEMATVDAWLASDPANREVLRGMRELRVVQGALSPEQVDSAWKDFAITWLHTPTQQAPVLGKTSSRTLPVAGRPARPAWRGVFAAAAIALVAGAIGGTFATQWKPGKSPVASTALRTFSTAKGQRATIQLVDGSRVTLGPESRVDVSPDFSSGSGRNIEVRGAAYFEVTHDPASPFTVRSGDAVVQVIGTAFSVVRYEQDTSVHIVVSQGKVAVRGDSPDAGLPAAAPVILTQGESAEFLAAGHTIVHRDADMTREFAWLDGELRFRQMPLSDVVHILERWYDVSILVPDRRIAEQRITATFGREGISEIMAQIARAVSAQCRYEERTTIVCRPQ